MGGREDEEAEQGSRGGAQRTICKTERTRKAALRAIMSAALPSTAIVGVVSRFVGRSWSGRETDCALWYWCSMSPARPRMVRAVTSVRAERARRAQCAFLVRRVSVVCGCLEVAGVRGGEE